MKNFENNFLFSEEYCIRLTSSNSDECVVNPASHTGSPITLTQNGNLIHTVPSRFSDDEYCLPAGHFDAENDIFELKYTGGNRNNGVSLQNYSCIYFIVAKLNRF